MTRREVTTRVMRTWLGEDGILRTVILPGYEIDAKAAEEIWKVHQEILGSRALYSFVDARRLSFASCEARAVVRRRQRQRDIRALAVVVGSPVSRLIGSFFLKLDKPVFPTRLFTDEADAIAWLKHQMAAATLSDQGG